MKKQLPLILILLVGIATPLISTWLFFTSPPAETTAHGEILQPSQLPGEWNLEGKWTLLYASSGECDERCRRRLCEMRQLRLMLPGQYYRLHRAWLRPPGDDAPSSVQVTPDCGEPLASEYAETAKPVNAVSDLIIIYDEKAALPQPSDELVQNDYLYLSDPSGILAMRFPPDIGIYQIRKDLSRLLKLSKGRKKIAR